MRVKRRSTTAQVIDQATRNLLTALKKDILIKEGSIDRDKLRKKGYSERLLNRFEEV